MSRLAILLALITSLCCRAALNRGGARTLIGIRSILPMALALAVSRSATATAEVIRFQMTGTVQVYDPTFVLPPDVVTGAPFTAFLTYDTSVPDSLPDNPRRGRYELSGSGTEFGLALTVGGLTLRNDPTSTFLIEILDNASLAPGISPPIDSFMFHGGHFIGGPPAQLKTIQVFWDNLQMDSWASDSLPVSLDPGRFRRAEVLAGGGAEQPPLGRPYDIVAFVREVTVVPEPATIAYSATVAIVLAAFAYRKRCRRRTHR